MTNANVNTSEPVRCTLINFNAFALFALRRRSGCQEWGTNIYGATRTFTFAGDKFTWKAATVIASPEGYLSSLSMSG